MKFQAFKDLMNSAEVRKEEMTVPAVCVQLSQDHISLIQACMRQPNQ